MNEPNNTSETASRAESAPVSCSASSDALETPETDLEVKLRSYRFCDAPDANIYINADRAKKLERQRNAAWKTLKEIRELFAADGSFGATAEALFAKPPPAQPQTPLQRKICEALNRRGQGEMALGYLRYEALRKLSPAKYKELCRRNISGEHFDTMIDQLIATTP